MVSTTFVTGARAKTGAPLVSSLAARDGHYVRGGTSSPGARLPDGADAVPFSWDEPDGWRGALDGVDSLFVVRPDRPDAPELIAALLAQAPPDAHAVLLSERAADYPQLDRWGLRCEDAVRSAASTWSIVRPSWFMQVFTDPRFFLPTITDEGVLPFPSGGAPVAWIDARDIAAVAEHALLDPALQGQVLELSGPAALSLEATAAALSPLAGRPVRHVEQTIAEALEGMDGFERALSEVTYERVRDGVFAEVTGVVESVTGRPAITLEQLVADAAAGT